MTFFKKEMCLRNFQACCLISRRKTPRTKDSNAKHNHNTFMSVHRPVKSSLYLVHMLVKMFFFCHHISPSLVQGEIFRKTLSLSQCVPMLQRKIVLLLVNLMHYQTFTPQLPLKKKSPLSRHQPLCIPSTQNRAVRRCRLAS